MSQIPSHANEITEPKKSSGSKVWITASFLLSGTILIWAFSTPFRAGKNQAISSANGSHDLIDSADQRQLKASEVRAHALEMDREFMTQLDKRRKLAFPEVPGQEEVKRHWVRRVGRAREQLKSLQSASPGTLEAEYRDSLAE